MKRLDDPYFDVTPAVATGYLERDDGHKIYWEEAGNPTGVPLVILHGGPGGSCQPGYRRFADPSALRIIQFDQRGCGKSEPKGELANNTLQALVDDMEALRKARGIDRWIVTGGSWGSTLALAYAETHPDRCLGLMLVSMWLCRRSDIRWWFHGVRTVFPELWEQFANVIPEDERGDLRKAYCKRILGDNQDVAAEAATKLYLYEEGFMRFSAPLQPPDPSRGPNYGRIFAHYAAHDYFLEEKQLLRNAPNVAHLPAVMVTGRYDMCTTPDNSYDLAQLLPNADLRIVPGAGHYPTEERMSVACVEGLRDLIARVKAEVEGQG